MATQGVLTLNTKPYNPRGVSDGIAKWALVGDTSFGGATSNLTQSVRGPSKDGIVRVQASLQVPKAATADSACGCVGQITGTMAADVIVRIPTSFTLAERQDFVDRLQAYIANAVFDDAVADLEPAW